MRILSLALALSIACSGAAASTSHFPFQIPDKGGARFERASLPCMDSSMFGGGGSCPSPVEACKEVCDDEYAWDNLRCMAGAGGILIEQRVICHAKATQIYAQCLRDCDDIYG
jgi:hypothetical protein